MDLIGASVTPGTWRQYGNAWAEWLSLVDSWDVATCDNNRLEVSLDSLLRLCSEGCSGLVASRRMAGDAFYFRLLGWHHVTKAFLVTQALKGWSKCFISGERRRPVSFELPKRLIAECSGTCYSDYESLLFSTAFALMFFTALRIGELLPSSATVGGGLRGGQVLQDLDNVCIYISRSKTDAFGRGIWLPIWATTSWHNMYRAIGLAFF